MGLWFAIKYTGDHGDIAHKWRKNDSWLMIIEDYIYILLEPSNVSGLAVLESSSVDTTQTWMVEY
jgi:hypothetical protein